MIKLFFVVFMIVFIGCIWYVLFFLEDTEYMAELITEENNCRVNYEILDDNCILIKESSCCGHGVFNDKCPKIYCGKFIVKNLENQK